MSGIVMVLKELANRRVPLMLQGELLRTRTGIVFYPSRRLGFALQATDEDRILQLSWPHRICTAAVLVVATASVRIGLWWPLAPLLLTALANQSIFTKRAVDSLARDCKLPSLTRLEWLLLIGTRKGKSGAIFLCLLVLVGALVSVRALLRGMPGVLPVLVLVSAPVLMGALALAVWRVRNGSTLEQILRR